MAENKDRIIRKSTLDQQGQENDLADTTPAERVGMMWQLAINAWLFKDGDVAQPEFSRHITKLLR